MKIRLLLFALVVACGQSLGFDPAPGQCQTQEVHGADSSFRTGDIGICWGMLRGAPGSDVQVMIRIRILSEGAPQYAEYAIKAVNPLTKAAEWVVPRRSLDTTSTATASRESFKNLIGRRIHFYRAAASEPELIIYYNGVPDTTPELSDAAQLEQYFDMAFKRLVQR